MDEELALAQLKALLNVPGALRVITNEVRPDLRVNRADPASPARPDVDWEHLRVQPTSFVLHQVMRLETRGRPLVRAHTTEGDWCEGKASALLRRLQEWQA